MDGVGSKLEWSLRALAQPAAIQQQLFPDFTESADELALNFEEAYREARESPAWRGATEEQRATVAELDRHLELMSKSDGDLWTKSSLETSVEWSRTRNLAKRALLSLGWSATPPPVEAAIYVRG